MSDVMPNYHVEKQRLKHQMAAQRATIEQQKLAIMEMSDRKMRHLENIESAEEAISNMNAKLKSLEEAHGKEDQYEKMKDDLDDEETEADD